jgi:hypothetical protein
MTIRHNLALRVCMRGAVPLLLLLCIHGMDKRAFTFPFFGSYFSLAWFRIVSKVLMRLFGPDALIGLLFNLNTYKFDGCLFSTTLSIRPRFCEYFLELIRRLFSTYSFFLNSRSFAISDFSSYTIYCKILARLCSFKRIPLT